MKDYQIVIFKDSENRMWYTAQERKFWIIFYWGRWKNMTPMMQPTYADAERLINIDKKQLEI